MRAGYQTSLLPSFPPLNCTLSPCLSPSIPPWQADCNPNLLLTSPLQPFQVKHYSRRRELLGSPRPRGGTVRGRCWVEANARPVATGPSLRCLWGCGRWGGGGGGRPGSLYPVPTSLQLHTQLLRSQAGQWAGGSLGRVEKGCPGTTEALGLGQVRALLLAVTPGQRQAGGRTGNKMFRRAVSAASNRFCVPRPQCFQQRNGGRGAVC